MPDFTEKTLYTTDNTLIVCTHFAPDNTNNRVIVINSAMGVPQRFYARYATYLAKHGFYVITYDYRGIGKSLTGNLRGQSMSVLYRIRCNFNRCQVFSGGTQHAASLQMVITIRKRSTFRH